MTTKVPNFEAMKNAKRSRTNIDGAFQLQTEARVCLQIVVLVSDVFVGTFDHHWNK